MRQKKQNSNNTIIHKKLYEPINRVGLNMLNASKEAKFYLDCVKL